MTRPEPPAKIPHPPRPVVRTAWLAALALGACLAAGGVILVLILRQKEDLLEGWKSRLSEMADERKAAVEGRLREREITAAMLAAFPVVRNAVASPHHLEDPSSRAHTVEVLEAVRSQIGALTVSILDKDLAERVRVGGPLPGGALSLLQAREGGETRSGLFPLERDPTVVVATTVPGERPSVAEGWVVLVQQARADLWPILLTNRNPTRTGETQLLAREGRDLVFLSPLRHRPGGEPLRLPYVATRSPGKLALEGKEGIFETIDHRGTPVLAATRFLPGPGWGLVATVDRAEALERLWRESGWGFALLLFVAGAVATSVFLARAVERLRTSEVLRRQEERYRIVVERANDAIVWIRPADGRILEANRAAEQLWGYSRAELLELSILEIRPPDESAQVRTQMAEAHEDGLLFRTTHVRKDRSRIRVEVSSRGAILDGEEVLVSVIRDVSESEAATERVLFVNGLLRTIGAANQVIVKERDPVRLLEAVCRAFVEEGGFLMAWIGVPEAGSDRLVPAATAGQVQGYFEEASIRTTDVSEGRGPAGTAYRERRTVVIQDWEADPRVEPWREPARRRGFRAGAACPFEREGEVVGVLTIYSSIPHVFVPEVVALLQELSANVGFALELAAADEKRRTAEAKLRTSEERFARFMDQIPAAAFVVDEELRVVWANRYLEEHLGIGALQDRSTDEAIHGPEAGGMVEDDRRALRGETVARIESVATAGGDRRVFRTLKFPLSGPEGRPLVGGISVDVTEQVEAEAEIYRLAATLEERVRRRTGELEAKSSELEAFAYSVSHDLRAPLRAIDGFSKILQEEHASSLHEDGQHVLSVIRGNAQRMGRLIDDLLTFSRAGRREMRKSRVDVAALVRSLLDELLPEEERARTEVRVGPLPEAQADPSLLRQVWVNLLSNSLKFSATNDRRLVEIDGERTEGQTVYRVRDNGVGFDMSYAHKLFAVFQRLHGREFEGTGIGLALVERIVKRHGGTVSGVSEPGQGTTFTFSLPDEGGEA